LKIRRHNAGSIYKQMQAKFRKNRNLFTWRKKLGAMTPVPAAVARSLRIAMVREID
jgi:hypothetical protein